MSIYKGPELFIRIFRVTALFVIRQYLNDY